MCRSLEGAGGSIFSVQHLCSSPARFPLTRRVCWIMPCTRQLSWKPIKREHCHREKPSLRKPLSKPQLATCMQTQLLLLLSWSDPSSLSIAAFLGQSAWGLRTPHRWESSPRLWDLRLWAETCSLLGSQKGCVCGQSSGQR